MPRQKQQAPVRNPHASVLVSTADAAADLSEDELDVFGPPLTARRARDDDEDMFFVEEEEGATGKKKRAKTTATAGGGEGKPKAPRASRAAMSTTVYEEDESFDADALAADYVAAADGGDGGATGALGQRMHAQLLTAARLGAAHNKAEVAIVETGVGERPTFIASFAFQSKQFQDEGPLYSVGEMAAVLAQVLRRQSTKRRKATASHPSVQLAEIARRSPPIFWSIQHAFPADAGRGLTTVLGEAEAAMEMEG